MPRWPLPKQDYWSTPFAEALLQHLDLVPGATILDIASGDGIPAFYLAEQVGPTGHVLGIDWDEHLMASARSLQGPHLPWLRFECLDMRTLSARLPAFDRITGNLSVMFFRPNRFETVRGLIDHLKPGGQLVLTFPSLGTFDSLWRRIDQEMAAHDVEELVFLLVLMPVIFSLHYAEPHDRFVHLAERLVVPRMRAGGDQPRHIDHFQRRMQNVKMRLVGIIGFDRGFFAAHIAFIPAHFFISR